MNKVRLLEGAMGSSKRCEKSGFGRRRHPHIYRMIDTGSMPGGEAMTHPNFAFPIMWADELHANWQSYQG
jgi:hypothetical protein